MRTEKAVPLTYSIICRSTNYAAVSGAVSRRSVNVYGTPTSITLVISAQLKTQPVVICLLISIECVTETNPSRTKDLGHVHLRQGITVWISSATFSVQ